MQPTRLPCAIAILIAAAVLPDVATAKTRYDPAPPDPVLLPEPTARQPDLDDLIEGNGKLHFSGQWRHWGDSRNSGELVQMLVAPDAVLGRRSPNGLPSSRFCNDNPDAC